MTLVIAHRGWSGIHPEQSRAAYGAAIDLAARTGRRLGLECDIHFSADDRLICLHDLDLARTGGLAVAARDLTLAELKAVDIGSWKVGPGATPEQRELLSVAELLDLVAAARAEGTDVFAVLEAKHPNPRGTDVERALAQELRGRGWTGADAPVRMISFDPDAVATFAELLPDVPRSQLQFPTPWTEGVRAPAISPWLGMVRRDPDLVRRAHDASLEVHVWTVNEPADIDFCLDLGVDAITSDHPDRVLERVAP
ncbi:glycerophosphoryl diester phosphodiesterase [Raineyella antarctica]|uniref:Glycerophosphoryl diester phosphodiesterase n=1 Tax=Raineyella antarctica TaxID=1577474 RepID=A0A1G6HFI0_9ACTN|nr:glycerophosphodiester phosphodiesterase family protein [Raineyella antarctica]SDB92868.1 glycerophosphoryl diester phosphodiesterase [Raineyella antarctica]